MANLWVTFSTDSSGTFTELSGNIIFNLNISYNFNGNLIDISSDFIIYELSNNPIQSGISLQATNWKELYLNTSLNPLQGYWLGGINTNLPEIFFSRNQLVIAVNNWITNPIPVRNIYGLIENWDVENVINMSDIFNGANNFNRHLDEWNVENVTDMSGMFLGASSFNQDLNEWDVGNVTNMNSMFRLAYSFNGNISSWNVGNVTDMTGMFIQATSFNQDISKWNVENVTDMNGMFTGVDHFISMDDKIHGNGTPFNYFISQTNTISVSIRYYVMQKFSTSTGTILILSETVSNFPDSDVDRVKNHLNITNMDDLVNYSFTSSEDSTSRDILSVWKTINESSGKLYYYNLSGAITNQSYYTPGPYTLTFTRRT